MTRTSIPIMRNISDAMHLGCKKLLTSAENTVKDYKKNLEVNFSYCGDRPYQVSTSVDI